MYARVCGEQRGRSEGIGTVFLSAVLGREGEQGGLVRETNVFNFLEFYFASRRQQPAARPEQQRATRL